MAKYIKFKNYNIMICESAKNIKENEYLLNDIIDMLDGETTETLEEIYDLILNYFSIK